MIILIKMAVLNVFFEDGVFEFICFSVSINLNLSLISILEFKFWIEFNISGSQFKY